MPAETYFWLDAGACVLRPAPEVFETAERMGYFCCTNHWPVDRNLSEAKRIALDVSREALSTMASMNGGVHALRKSGKGLWILRRFYDIAVVEQNMIPTDPWHRHDQPILSVLLYQAFGQPLFADFATYAGWKSPREVVNQKVWVHRTRMQPEDQDYFIRALDSEAAPHIPADLPPTRPDRWFRKVRIRIAKWRGRYPRNKAGESIDDGVRD